MSLTLRTLFGSTEAVIDEDISVHRFYQIAHILGNELDVKFLDKEDEFDSISWHFLFHGHQLTLHYSIYNGISIFPTRLYSAKRRENRAVEELSSVLADKLIAVDRRMKLSAV
ncbi:MAG: DUF3630 family protein [Chitinophagaceae bacterium]